MTPRLADTPVLETDRLILRAPGPQDWPAWRAMMASERSRFIRPHAVDDSLAWRAFGHVIGHWALRGYGNFVFTRKSDDTALGMAGPWFPEGWPEREIGWSVWSAEAEGRGYAFEAVQSARAHAYDILGWDTAVSYVAPENSRSIALAERLGARRDDRASGPGNTPCLVYRHPSPDRLVDGSIEAYA
ncbi:GNAT family N-acetyltransferase [Sedimentitalea sp. HM32M-2]|uniref:GNAT family N-acetyltransferase n=1 Tax=Sedimentitalea sp. HM32M-2 TaxID=3351566 RepID=UPI003632DEFA